jgi:hypothetical protein
VIEPESVEAEKVAVNMAVEVWVHVDVDGLNSFRTVQPTNYK